MIEWVLRNVGPLDHDREYLVIDRSVTGGPTRGAVETLLKARPFIKDMDRELIVANCDQLISLDDDFAVPIESDGVIFTFKSGSPAHSYVVQNDEGFIWSIVEKPESPPSTHAVSGVYWFARARDLFEACDVCLNSHENTGGELYLSTALAFMLGTGKKLYARDVPTTILGTPEDFQRFEVAMACAS